MVHTRPVRACFAPLRLFAAIVLALSPAAPRNALAQTIPATIAGQVNDETGGALPGATVTLRDARMTRERVVVTDAAGRFSADQLIPGSYTLTVQLGGFETLTR